MHFYFKLLL
jgi:hypothetical protein